MRVAIIGGGFVGLSSAVYLVDKGHQPVLFEANEICGGLARGFKDNEWRWSLENFYHHIFTNDQEIINFSKKVGCALNIKHPITSSFFRSEEIVLDSPLSLLKFSGISFWSRLRMGVGLGLLKLIPNGLFLEKFRAVDVLPKLLGKEGYRDIWDKLLKTKFGPFVNEVNLAWFWGRVAKRTKNLGYFEEVSYETEPASAPNRRDIVFKVKEIWSRKIGLGKFPNKLKSVEAGVVSVAPLDADGVAADEHGDDDADRVAHVTAIARQVGHELDKEGK